MIAMALILVLAAAITGVLVSPEGSNSSMFYAGLAIALTILLPVLIVAGL